MTRQEQIEQAAYIYGFNNPNGHWNADAEYEEDCVTPSLDFEAGAEWADAHPDLYSVTRKAVERALENLWHDAQGDFLPDIDREVIVLCKNGKVCYGHRPKEYWDGKNISTGEVTRHYPKRYDKGGWNIPDVKWWLDVDLPNLEE